MKKMVVKKQVQDKDELKLFVDETLLYVVEKFGWDKFIAEAHIENDVHVIVIVEKEER